MKHMKKFVSLALALMMALALCVPALAQEGEGYSITVQNSVQDAEYKLYKIFDAEVVNEDSANGIIYSYEGNLPTSLAKVFVKNETTGNIDIIDPKPSDEVIMAAVKEWAETASPVKTKTGNGGSLTFDGLENGYYAILSSVSNGSAVTITSIAPNVTVIDKNQKPGPLTKNATAGFVWDESVEEKVKAAEIGEDVDFEITYNATNYNGEKKITNYFIKDDIPDGFDLKKDTIKVYVGTKKVVDGETVIDYGDALENTAYTITYYNADDTDDFMVKIPWVDEKENHLYDSATVIKITYKAAMNEKATIAGEGNTNTAEVYYTDTEKPDEPDPKEPWEEKDTETVYTYALTIKKVDQNGNALAGAKFALTQDGENVYVTGGNGVYTVIATPMVEDENGNMIVDPTASNIVESPADGLIVIKGLKKADYTLTETEAPAGYNKLAGSVTVAPTLAGSSTTTVTKYFDKDGNLVEENTETATKVEVTPVVPAIVEVIVNVSGSLLPSTGGIGTTIFYVVGGILVAGAAILLMTRKRVSEDD